MVIVVAQAVTDENARLNRITCTATSRNLRSDMDLVSDVDSLGFIRVPSVAGVVSCNPRRALTRCILRPFEDTIGALGLNLRFFVKGPILIGIFGGFGQVSGGGVKRMINGVCQ